MTTLQRATMIESQWRFALIWRARWHSMQNYVWVGCGGDAAS
jgi:hypothetical protein